MLKKTIFLSGLMALPLSSQAAPCVDLKTCAKAMFDLTGERYFWEADAEKVKLGTSPDIELTKENAEVVFTALLDEASLARAPVGDGKTFRIVFAKDRREMESPILDASFDKAPEIPNSWDWVTLRYHPKSRELTETIEKDYRFHLPREGRMQGDYNAGVVLVMAPAPTVRHMYEILKGADVPQTAAVKKHFEELEQKRLAILEHQNPRK
jgi:hypothetical protein